MANYYTQFSTMIKDLTDEERKWWEKYQEEKAERRESNDDDYFTTCNVELQNDGAWLYADDSCNIDSTAELIQRFLSENRPDQCHSFEWAETCSKPRLDEFGGGGCFITATEIKFFLPSNDIFKAEQEFESKK